MAWDLIACVFYFPCFLFLAAPTAVDSSAVEPPAERQARTEAEQAEDEEKAEAREGEEGWQQVPEVPVLPPGMLGVSKDGGEESG